MAERTNLINQLRAILLERGVIFPTGRRKFELGVDGMLVEGDHTLSLRIRQLADQLRTEWKELDAKIAELNGEFVNLARNDPAARRLTSIPGVGVLNSPDRGGRRCKQLCQGPGPGRLARVGSETTQHRWEVSASRNN